MAASSSVDLHSEHPVCGDPHCIPTPSGARAGFLRQTANVHLVLPENTESQVNTSDFCLELPFGPHPVEHRQSQQSLLALCPSAIPASLLSPEPHWRRRKFLGLQSRESTKHIPLLWLVSKSLYIGNLSPTPFTHTLRAHLKEWGRVGRQRAPHPTPRAGETAFQNLAGLGRDTRARKYDPARPLPAPGSVLLVPRHGKAGPGAP